MHLRKSCPGIDVLVGLGFDPSRQFWDGQSVASVSLFCQLVKIHPMQTQLGSVASHSVHTFGEYSVYLPPAWDIHISFQLPDSIQDDISTGSQQSTIVTHCRHELMHKVWSQLLDDDFVTAYTHGFVIKCLDGQSRRFYPRIFTYSADYPEKYVLLFAPICITDHVILSAEFYLLQCETRDSALVRDVSFARSILTKWAKSETPVTV